jgi:hypothetical protein
MLMVALKGLGFLARCNCCLSSDSNSFPWWAWTWACCSYLQARKWSGGFAYLGFLVQGRPFCPFSTKKHLSYSAVLLLILIMWSMI